MILSALTMADNVKVSYHLVNWPAVTTADVNCLSVTVRFRESIDSLDYANSIHLLISNHFSFFGLGCVIF